MEMDMPLNEKNDPEMAYRRGYQDGASEMLSAVERFLDPAARQIARSWIKQDIDGWRLKAMLGRPPTWRLNELLNASDVTAPQGRIRSATSE
jgi:hypothetical protein